MIMKHILVLLAFSLLPNFLFSQTISGTFFGDRIKRFKLSENYIDVDGFGSKKTVKIERSGPNSQYKLRFYSESYCYWLSTVLGIVYLNIEPTKCSCKPYKFKVKKFKKVDLR